MWAGRRVWLKRSLNYRTFAFRLFNGFHTPSGVLREGGPLTSLFPYLLEVEAKVLN